MYKAIKEVGGYKIGDIVPDEKAEHWNKVYRVPHCEKVEGKSSKPKEEIIEEKKLCTRCNKYVVFKDGLCSACIKEPEEKASEPKEETPSNDAMIDDYLDRNTGVVISNIKRDGLSSETLKKLLAHEKSEKKRKPVIRALKKAMK